MISFKVVLTHYHSVANLVIWIREIDLEVGRETLIYEIPEVWI